MNPKSRRAPATKNETVKPTEPWNFRSLCALFSTALYQSRELLLQSQSADVMEALLFAEMYRADLGLAIDTKLTPIEAEFVRRGFAVSPMVKRHKPLI
jgi:hypothetical protein